MLFISGLDPIKKYKNAEAVELLFKNTLEMRGRKRVGDSWQETTHGMDSGVKTIVVGIIDESLLKDPTVPNKTKDEVRNIIEGLEATAAWGQPKLRDGGDPTVANDWIADPTRKPYLVSNVAELTGAMEEILKRVASGVVGSGAPVSMPPLEGVNADGTRTIIAASIKTNNDDQWNARLNRISMDKYNTEVSQWEADGKMRIEVKNPPNDRQLYTWLQGQEVIELRDLKGQGHWNKLAGIRGKADTEKFRDWLYSFDVNLPEDQLPPDGSIGVLGEMSRSNIMVVGKPKAESLKIMDPLDPFGRLFRTDPEKDYSVYLQTNRGFLHSLNYATGAERWAFIPPIYSKTESGI